ncbi:hypothetical protein SBRY_10916 [Actinacidiphila bryophytorum]|uniref:Uncharacterized protein n=1 Tax=Actinacidiphila bryophytorum TaxID=1436133 RepID=A0A9W4E6N2_9ACTN|nr:hypothetical protein SBRY_10916 [Actinacidiphila bryophytorum]
MDHGRPGERPVLRRQPALQRQRPDDQLPLHHRHHQGRAQPLGHPRRQRPVRWPVHLLQRCTAQRVGLQPDEEAGRDHPRHRRRQQQGSAGHLLRGRHDLRLPLGRHRERRPGQHQLRRLRQRLQRRHRLPGRRVQDVAARHHLLLHRRLHQARRRRQQRGDRRGQLVQLQHRQGRLDLDRPRGPGQQRLRVLRVGELLGQVPAPLQLQAPTRVQRRQHHLPAGRHLLPAERPERPGLLAPVGQLPRQVPAPLQLHRLHRLERRLQRLGLRHLLGRRRELGPRVPLGALTPGRTVKRRTAGPTGGTALRRSAKAGPGQGVRPVERVFRRVPEGVSPDISQIIAPSRCLDLM